MRIVRWIQIPQVSFFMRVGDLLVFSGLFSGRPKKAGIITHKPDNLETDQVKVTMGEFGERTIDDCLHCKFGRSVWFFHLRDEFSKKAIEYFKENNALVRDPSKSDAEFISQLWGDMGIDIKAGLSVSEIVALPMYRDIFFQLRGKIKIKLDESK